MSSGTLRVRRSNGDSSPAKRNNRVCVYQIHLIRRKPCDPEVGRAYLPTISDLKTLGQQFREFYGVA